MSLSQVNTRCGKISVHDKILRAQDESPYHSCAHDTHPPNNIFVTVDYQSVITQGNVNHNDVI